jgi:DNA-binding transcriptional LysR family regulator
MTLDQLQVFQTIVKTGSFRAASQKLHRAQSAVSYAIKTLEDELGFPLFDRTSYRPKLTVQGQSFVKKTDEFIAHFDELKSSSKFLQLGHEPVIRLSVSGLWPIKPLAKALAEFKKKFPHTEIKIYTHILSGDQLLLNNKVDLVFGELFNDMQLLIYEELFQVQMFPLCSPRSALAALKGKASLEDLRQNTQVILRSTVEDNPRTAKVFNPANTISVADFQTKKELLLAGLGWGFMPEHIVKEEIKQKTLIPTHSERMRAPMSIGYNPNHAMGPCGQFLWDYFTAKK